MTHLFVSILMFASSPEAHAKVLTPICDVGLAALGATLAPLDRFVSGRERIEFESLTVFTYADALRKLTPYLGHDVEILVFNESRDLAFEPDWRSRLDSLLERKQVDTLEGRLVEIRDLSESWLRPEFELRLESPNFPKGEKTIRSSGWFRPAAYGRFSSRMRAHNMVLEISKD